MSETVPYVDFSDIADCELLTATQLIEQNIGNSLFAPIDFSDIPADTPQTVNLPCGVSPSCAAAYNVEFSDISDAELLEVDEFQPAMRFRQPVSAGEMENIAGEKLRANM